jgi:elongation factor G
MTSMFVPKPVISVAVRPKDSGAEMNMSKALNRFTKEDPTFASTRMKSHNSHHHGMGELHLAIYMSG